jgi:hypothetical protein
MTRIMAKCLLIICLAAAGWLWNGDIHRMFQNDLVSIAEAVVGAPATPVSYAGVARRTTARVATPGVNLGGPVNRVGVR